MNNQSLVLFLALALVRCGTPAPTEIPTTTNDTAAVATKVPVEWTGYYTGKLPCTDCPGIETTLWVRGDSSFILQQLRIDRDTVPQGLVGSWTTVNGLMTIGYAGDKPDFYRSTGKGVLLVDEMGVAPEKVDVWTLEKLADEIGDAIPRMRITGTFTYVADAQSFQLCGTRFPLPCVGGMDMGEEEGEPLIAFTNADLQKAYAKAVKKGGDPWTIEAICTIGMGPAMEGDGADEYIFIEQIIGPAQCP